jgi:hypothetical protein
MYVMHAREGKGKGNLRGNVGRRRRRGEGLNADTESIYDLSRARPCLLCRG